MNGTAIQQGVENLKELVRMLARDGITSRSAFNEWRKGKKHELAILFDYEQKTGMPEITSLVSASFHPELPLVMFNYSSAAHNTLHAFPEGWTPTLRLCRGIVFELSPEATLVAMGFPKFFNYGEHPESTDLPDEPFHATVKHDGHLGIIFHYRGKWHLTTRGDFESPSAVLGNKILKAHLRQNLYWRRELSQKLSILVEIVGPETHVHVNYSETGFILIGAWNLEVLRDFDHDILDLLGISVNLPVAACWQGSTIKDLVEYMKDLSVTDQEGFVVRFASGMRVKFKFASYINLMVASKLSHKYLMARVMSGNLDKMIRNLPEEVRAKANEMLGALMHVLFLPGTQKERWTYLYSLVPPEEATTYYKGICRDFVRFVDTHWQYAVEVTND